MPMLNRIFLKEIFHRAACDERWMTKFILAGKETLDVVATNFCHTMKVEIEKPWFCIYVKYKGSEPKRYLFKYNSVLLKVIVPVEFVSIQELAIESWPDKTIENKMDLGRLLSGNFNILSLGYGLKLSGKAKKILMTNQAIQILKSSYPTFSEIPIIPKACHELILKNFYFGEFIDEKSHELSFQKIKKLGIESKDVHFYFKPSELRRLILYIAKHFPNLETLNINLKMIPSLITIPNIQSIDSTIFQSLPLTIKGDIQLGGILEEENLLEFLDAAGEQTNLKVNETVDEIIIFKEFLIHEGFTFKFNAALEKKHIF